MTPQHVVYKTPPSPGGNFGANPNGNIIMIFIIRVAPNYDATFYVYKESKWLHKSGVWVNETSFMEFIKNLQYKTRRQAIQKLKEVEGVNVRFKDA